MSAPQVLEAKRYPDLPPLIGGVQPADLIVIWKDTEGKNFVCSYDEFVSGISGTVIADLDLDLNDLGDVAVVTPAANQVLSYNSTTQVWENKTLTVGMIQGLQLILDQFIGSATPLPTPETVVSRDEDGASGFQAVDFDTVEETPDLATAFKTGRVRFNKDDGTIEVDTDIEDVTLQLGQESVVRVRNTSGSTIFNGTVVRVNGSTGIRPTIVPALADDLENARGLIGVVTADIEDNAFGFVTTQGLVRHLDLSDFADGDDVYLSDLVPGGLTTSKGLYVAHVGVVVHNGVGNGVLLVNIQQALNKVAFEGVSLGAGLSYDLSGNIRLGDDYISYIEGQSLSFYVQESSPLRYLDNSNFFSSGTIFAGADMYDANVGGGGYSSSIGTNNVISSLYLLKPNFNQFSVRLDYNSSTDIFQARIIDGISSKGFVYGGDYESNFTARSLVTKQYVDGAISGAGHSPVTVGTPANGLSINPTTQVLTIGLASTSATGALSSTDWNTFNNKLNLTSPITGYTVGANTALADTDTILQAFGKVQGQINARISGSGTNQQVAIWNTSGSIQSNINLTHNGNTLFATSTSIVDAPIIASSFGGVAGIVVRRANGTISSPTAILANEFIGGLVSRGHNGTGFTNISSGGLYIYASQNWTTTANGTFIAFETTANGGTSRTEKLRINHDGQVGINTGSPTNTLDVNGTARIRTINNLGTAATSVLVPSATGVVSLRTLAELASDGGLTNFWTLVGSDIYRNSSVAIGRTTIPAGNLLTLRQTTNDDTVTSLRCERLDGALRFEVRNSYALFQQEVAISGLAAGVQALRVQQRTNDDTVASILTQNLSGSTRFECRNSYSQFFHEVVVNGLSTSTQAFRIRNNNTNSILVGQNNSGTTVFQVANTGMITSRGLTVTDSFDIVFATTTGTKIGTATDQKFAFWNATPIVQPTTSVASGTLVSNSGTTLTSTDTIDGYTLQQVVRALRNTGLLA